MPVDPQLLDQLLSTPESRDVADSPIVTAIVLQDPRNAADLVPFLDQVDSRAAANARRVLCLFEATAAQHLLAALAGAGIEARKEGLEVFAALLLGEEARSVRETLSQSAADLAVLFDDRRPLPDDLPEHTERDFEGRICDLAYIVVQLLSDDEFDQSTFRALDDQGRDQAIQRLQRRGFGLTIV